MQKQYVEKPGKVLAEAYDPAADPLQAGVCVCAGTPLQPSDGRPHVHTTTVMWMLTAGEWITRNVYREDYTVLSDEEFTDRFGQSGGPAGGALPA